jgi:hypothetical protein
VIFLHRGRGAAGSLPKRTNQNRSDEMTSGAEFNFAQRYRVAKKLMKSYATFGCFFPLR